MTCCTFRDTNYIFFYFSKFDRNRGSHRMHFCQCICHTIFCMFSCLQINYQPFYLHQLLKFHPFDWLIKMYLQTEGQGTHHKMVSLQPMSGFPPLLFQVLSPVMNYSWENDDNGDMHPIMCTLLASPEAILGLVKCGCVKEYR